MSASAASAPASETAPAEAVAAEAALEQRFATWVAKFRGSALEAGIDETTLRSALDGVQYLPRVIELDRAQPEFTRTT
jgi:membrane-bound lytic murein transglycosylase B